jgi:hypothetical protein
VIEPAGGLFEGQVNVQLKAKDAQAKVHYTLDGEDPTRTSPLYSEPLAITQTTQVRAQAFRGETPLDAGTGAVFVARAFDTSSDIALVVIDGYGQGKPDRKEGGSWVTQNAAVVAIEPANGRARLSGFASLATRAGYHVRGESSSSFEKAPYKVEFWDETNSDVDLPFLSLPAESDWALLSLPAVYLSRHLVIRRGHFVCSSIERAMVRNSPRANARASSGTACACSNSTLGGET